LLLCLSL